MLFIICSENNFEKVRFRRYPEKRNEFVRSNLRN